MVDLSENADPFAVLSVNGGTRVTDAFEVFPKIEKKDDGWTPRYLVADLATAVADAPAHCVAKVVCVNPTPAPWQQRVLVEFSGRWERHESMSSSDFEPLVT